MMQYDLSIIIPFYNGNNELSKLLSALEIAIKQIDKIKVEIIIVNDSPNCKVNYQGFERLNIKIITNHKNIGIHGSRVNGILNSSGKYIFMIDQDDLIKENALVSQFTKIKDNDMIIANGFDENPLNYGMIYHSRKHQEKSQNLKYYFKIGCMIVSPGQCIIKKDAIAKEWLEYRVKTNGADDLLLWILMLKNNCKITINYENLYIHTYSGKNVSSDFDKMVISSNEVIEFLYDKNFISENEKKTYIRRLNMRRFYESKSKIKKFIAMLLYPDITWYLIKMKLE